MADAIPLGVPPAVPTPSSGIIFNSRITIEHGWLVPSLFTYVGQLNSGRHLEIRGRHYLLILNNFVQYRLQYVCADTRLQHYFFLVISEIPVIWASEDIF